MKDIKRKEEKIQKALGTLPLWRVVVKIKYEEEIADPLWLFPGEYTLKHVDVRALNKKSARLKARRHFKGGDGKGSSLIRTVDINLLR